MTRKFILNRSHSEYICKIHCATVINELSSWGHVNPIGIRACYDEGKRVAETLTYGYHHQDGVDVRVVRIFNTYGTFSLLLC